MSGLISREEAIKTVKFYETFCDPYPRVIEALEELPSVQPVTDCISRQQAIDLVESFYKIDKSVLNIMVFNLKQLPSVQPRKGKWTRHFDGNEWYWYCSSCKEQWYEEDLWMGGNSFPNFCPNCGSSMRPQFEEPEINPCRGCEDYDGKGGCKTKGGCADRRGESDE